LLERLEFVPCGAGKILLCPWFAKLVGEPVYCFDRLTFKLFIGRNLGALTLKQAGAEESRSGLCATVLALLIIVLEF
jgi:uncharacterized membrane protein YecN with MAPEG domain